MAYNNYGAFAYLNGVRQRDREDVTLDQILNENEHISSGGQAVYDHLIENSTVDDSGNIEYHEPDDEHELNHAVLGGPGDGVYLSVRRYGFSRSILFYVKGGKVVDKLAAEGIYALITNGKVAEDFDYWDYLNDEKLDVKFQWYGYNLHLMNLNSKKAYESGYPSSCASIISKDKGTEWRVFFDSSYGAGISDCYPEADSLFDTLMLNSWPHPFKTLDIVDTEINRDDEVDEEGQIWTTGQPNAPTVTNIHAEQNDFGVNLEVREFDGYHDWYKSRAQSTTDEGEYEAYGSINLNGNISRFFSDLSINAIDLAQILNVGIALHRLGVDAVNWSGNDLQDMKLYNVCKEARNSNDELEHLKNWTYFEDSSGKA